MVKGRGEVELERPRRTFTLFNVYFFNSLILYKEHCYFYKLKKQIIRKTDASLKGSALLGLY